MDAAVAGRELVGRERCVTRSEVDRAGGDLRDPAARSDRSVGDVDAGLRLVVGSPDGDERRDERAACAGEGVSGRGRSGEGSGRADAGGQDDKSSLEHSYLLFPGDVAQESPRQTGTWAERQ